MLLRNLVKEGFVWGVVEDREKDETVVTLAMGGETATLRLPLLEARAQGIMEEGTSRERLCEFLGRFVNTSVWEASQWPGLDDESHASRDAEEKASIERGHVIASFFRKALGSDEDQERLFRTGVHTEKQVLMNYRRLHLTGGLELKELANGDLRIRVEPEYMEEFREEIGTINKERGTNEAFHEMMSPYHEDDILVDVDGGYLTAAIGALTGSPIIVFGATMSEDGEGYYFHDDHKVWWFPDSVCVSEIDELLEKGEVLFERESFEQATFAIKKRVEDWFDLSDANREDVLIFYGSTLGLGKQDPLFPLEEVEKRIKEDPEAFYDWIERAFGEDIYSFVPEPEAVLRRDIAKRLEKDNQGQIRLKQLFLSGGKPGVEELLLLRVDHAEQNCHEFPLATATYSADPALAIEHGTELQALERIHGFVERNLRFVGRYLGASLPVTVLGLSEDGAQTRLRYEENDLFLARAGDEQDFPVMDERLLALAGQQSCITFMGDHRYLVEPESGASFEVELPREEPRQNVVYSEESAQDTGPAPA